MGHASRKTQPGPNDSAPGARVELAKRCFPASMNRPSDAKTSGGTARPSSGGSKKKRTARTRNTPTCPRSGARGSVGVRETFILQRRESNWGISINRRRDSRQISGASICGGAAARLPDTFSGHRLSQHLSPERLENEDSRFRSYSGGCPRPHSPSRPTLNHSDIFSASGTWWRKPCGKIALVTIPDGSWLAESSLQEMDVDHPGAHRKIKLTSA